MILLFMPYLQVIYQKNFFQSASNITSLIATFATFSIGYLVRPLGGILFGHFGDKFGRKKTFTFSILLMAMATFSIGLSSILCKHRYFSTYYFNYFTRISRDYPLGVKYLEQLPM